MVWQHEPAMVKVPAAVGKGGTGSQVAGVGVVVMWADGGGGGEPGVAGWGHRERGNGESGRCS